LKPAAKELGKLDRSIAKRIADRIQWLASNLDSTKLFPLKGDLSGLYKIRDGSYRIIFEILRAEQTIIIHTIGHRRDVFNLISQTKICGYLSHLLLQPNARREERRAFLFCRMLKTNDPRMKEGFSRNLVAGLLRC
jgi:mRNA interferase RelE/StbE